MGVRREGGPVLLYSRDWSGNLRTRRLTRPKPVTSISSASNIPLKNLPANIMRLWTLFMPVASLSYFELFTAIFGEGTLSSLNIKTISSEAVVKCAQDLSSKFRSEYMVTAKQPIVQWLCDFKQESWNWQFNTVTHNGLSSVLQQESANIVSTNSLFKCC